MVLILDGNSEHVAQKKNRCFGSKINFTTTVLNRCLEQIKLPVTLYTHTLVSELPFHKGSMHIVHPFSIYTKGLFERKNSSLSSPLFTSVYLSLLLFTSLYLSLYLSSPLVLALWHM